jgi:predicted 2-oxoglutarate/Fe(II)-dependent dioxygenase YbiX
MCTKIKMMLLVLCLALLVIYLVPRYQEPRVIPDFLSNDERNHIMKKAEKKLNISTIAVDGKVNRDIRVSETAWLELDDPIVRRVAERCVSLTDRPLGNCESLQVLRYKQGGHYKPHQDTFDDMKGNKRMYTIILALNDDYEEGETEFPNLKKKYKLKAGDALFFHTLDNYELKTSKALHGGRPVKSGEKWICNLWVHKYPYN